MILEKGPAYNSKILLFGEYSVIKGSMALSIPFDKFKGQLLFDPSSGNKKSNHYSVVYLDEYLQFLEQNKFSNEINIEEFKSDINNGLYFECNIPISYGLGSSGAIVASIYNAYSTEEETHDLSLLKPRFARMESYYHGSSSGLDPLVSYINKPLLIDDYGKTSIASLSKGDQNKNGSIFLIDTKTTGETQPLVNWFLEKYEDTKFRDKIQNQLVPLVNNCIREFLAGNHDSMIPEIKTLSEFTYENFKPMIPDSVVELWKKGLETNNYQLKLCGSGGGGMMLGFTKDLEKTLNQLQDFELHVL
ncbi:MAG: mevalonate kinase [Bacteroidetes bacterium]|nr:mevalonate kinase [Bacteroidota bacterium]